MDAPIKSEHDGGERFQRPLTPFTPVMPRLVRRIHRAASGRAKDQAPARPQSGSPAQGGE
jgi:hypothetical protein